MSRRACAYIAAVILAALIGCGLAAFPLPANPDWAALATFVVLAVVAQLFRAQGPTADAYHANLVFFFAGALLLHPLLFAILVLIPHLVEWTKDRLLKTTNLRDW